MSSWTLDSTPCKVVSCALTLGGAGDKAVVELLSGSAPPAGAWVTLKCDGTAVLYGRAKSGRFVEGSRDTVRVEIEGPWAVLESVTYQQSQKAFIGSTLTAVLTPDVQLGMDDDGGRRTTAQEIAAVVTYAIGAGVPITLDSDFTGRSIPVLETSGITCAGAIRAMLDHHPDVAMFFAYGDGSAALSFQTISGLPVVTISGGSAGTQAVESAHFEPVLNYKPQGVRIVYFRVGANGFLETQTPDVSGTIGTQGQEENVINWVIKLEGTEPGPVEEQEIRTRPIPEATTSGIVEPTDQSILRNFWMYHLDWFEDAIADSITIGYHSRRVHPPAASTDTSGELPDEDYSTDPDDYPRELLSGSLRPWMNFVSAPMTVKAKFRYNGTGTLPESLKAIFGESGTRIRTFEAQITGTDASTRTYRGLGENGTIPDFPSNGLAASFMSAFPASVWQGSVTVTGQNQLLVPLGKLLNVTGYDGSWATMGALIVGVSYDAQGHRTTVTVGPPAGLDFADFISSQRLYNNRPGRRFVSPAAAAARRVNGVSSGGKTKGGTRGASRSTSSPDGGGSSGSAGALQVQTRKVGTNYNIGITPGVFQGQWGSTDPTVEPGAVAMDDPVIWWAENITESKKIWAKWILDDTHPYRGALEAVQIHLRAFTNDPDPAFVEGDEQWIHLASIIYDSEAGLFATSHLQGSPWVIRDGGPGSGYVATAL